MLNLQNISLAYGARILLQNINLALYKGQRVGLIGKNGSGKTSLFRLILGEIEAEQGEVLLPNGCLISHIEQEINQPNLNLLEYVLLSNPLYSTHQTDLPEYYTLKPKAEKMLQHLGFKLTELNQALTSFSGGWQMRANLAKALFTPSDLLLLDEPTNHLDIETVTWLEEWINSYSGLALIISHDREFLDRVSNNTLALNNQSLKLYGGNYSTYETTYLQELELEQKAATKTKAKIEHLQSFVNRFRAKASKAKQAQSRLKMIEKLQVAAQVHADIDYQIDFLAPESKPDRLLSLTNATIGYPNKTLIKNASLQVFSGDRIGLLGKNGRGKTSLIKAILDQSTLIEGDLELAKNIKIGYFAQHTLELLDPQLTPYQLIATTRPDLKAQEIYDFLGRYAFKYERARDAVNIFSGGEKARLILANIIINQPNLLFLDEPTNHLDMAMREALAEALTDYAGAVVIVSHDKFLLESIVEDYYLINNQVLVKYNQDLTSYQKEILQAEKELERESNKPTPKEKHKFNNKPKISAANLLKLEQQINELNLQVQNLEHELLLAASNNELALELYNKINSLRIKLEHLENKWLSQA